jgi:anti-anti-sigma regulatory factor
MENNLRILFSFGVDEKTWEIKIVGALSAETCPYLRSKLNHLRLLPHSRLKLDLTDINSCDLAGINTLLGLHKRWQEARFCVMITLTAHSPLRPLLHKTKFDRILPLQITA